MNKRIAYLIQHDITTNDGVAKKIKSQVDSWRAYGAEVEVYAIVPRLGASIVDARLYKSSGYIRLRLKLNTDLLSDVSFFEPDVIYFRYNTVSRDFLWLSRRFKIVCELNTLDLDEFKLLALREKSVKAWLRYFSYGLLRGFVLRRVDGVIAVTNEILNHRTNKKFKRPGAVIPNSIDLDKYPTIKNLKDSDDRPSLFFIGTPHQPWHGVDIINEMARELPDYEFHVVGLTGNSLNNLTYYGYLPQSEYLKILKRCHICIGSLAMYRNNMEEACPLKVREYLSYGYPVIIGYADTAFMSGEKPHWLLQLTKNIDYHLLRKFIERNLHVVVRHEELAAISAANNEMKRVQFISGI